MVGNLWFYQNMKARENLTISDDITDKNINDINFILLLQEPPYLILKRFLP